MAPTGLTRDLGNEFECSGVFDVESHNADGTASTIGYQRRSDASGENAFGLGDQRLQKLSRDVVGEQRRALP